MKKRILTIILFLITVTSLVACGNSSNMTESKVDNTIETASDTKAPHEHAYKE